MESEPKMSSHAKRRQRKQQQKNEEQDTQTKSKEVQDTPMEVTKEVEAPQSKKEEAKKSGQPSRKQSDVQKGDNSAKGEKKNRNHDRSSKDRKSNGPQRTHFDSSLKAPSFVDREKVKESTETGFIGDQENWFDDEMFKRPKHKINFDNAKEHDYYFHSYSSHHIHEEMLKDTNRTLSYQRAIENNPENFKDKIVLDIGCGTGILSLFAAKAGAKHVYAVDNAEVALFAREIVKQNGFEDKITVYKGKMEEIEFPFKEGEVDIIISEWMGYFLLYESMLDCVLWARDKYLNKQTGKMLPDRAQMYVAAIEDSEYTHDKKTFWDDVYGFNMSCMATSIFKDPVVDTVPPAQIMSDSCCILDLDLVNMKQEDVNFSNFFALKMNHTDKVHALVSWFDTTFGDLQRPVCLTTSPMKKYTHWKQSVFYLEKPLDVRKGETLYGSIAAKQDKTNFRELNIKMSFHMEEQRIQKHFFQQYKFK